MYGHWHSHLNMSLIDPSTTVIGSVANEELRNRLIKNCGVFQRAGHKNAWAAVLVVLGAHTVTLFLMRAVPMITLTS